MSSEYPFRVTLYNIIQYLSQITGIAALCSFSLITIIGLLPQKKVLLGYQTLIMTMAGTTFLIGISWLFLLPLRTFDMRSSNVTYEWAQYYPPVVAIFFIEFWRFLARAFVEIMGCSMLYRTTLVIRPQWANKFGIFLFIAIFPYPMFQAFQVTLKLDKVEVCDLICLENNYTWPKAYKIIDRTNFEDSIAIWDNVLFLFVFICGIPCIIILNRWFKKGNYSPKTIEMQKRMTGAMVAMIITHAAIVLPDLMMTLGRTFDDLTGITILPFVFTIATILDKWVYPGKAWIIYMSCRNLLKLPRCCVQIKKKIKPTKSLIVVTNEPRS